MAGTNVGGGEFVLERDGEFGVRTQREFGYDLIGREILFGDEAGIAR